LTANDQIYGRYSYAKDIANPVTPLPEGSGNITSGILGLTDTRAQSFVGNYVHVFSNNTLNELRVGYTRRSINRAATSLDRTPSDALNIPGIPSNAAFENTLPTHRRRHSQLGSTTKHCFRLSH
jgi:hypothetical protein